MATRKPLYLDANGTPTEMNLSDELPVGLLPELTDLAVPAITLLEGVWPGDIIQFDGNKWRNAPLTFGSPGAAGSVCFYCASPSVHQKSSENDFPVHSLSTTPITTGELAVSVVCPADSEVVLAAWRYDTALGITTLPSGIWSPFIYCSVDDASGITWNTRNIAEIIGSGAITLTTSGSGTTRVATASSGFFASGDAGTTWLETPKGLYKITAYTSATQVTIAVPVTYENETVGFTGSRWKVLFATYSIDINGITPTEMPMGWDSVQNNFSIASSSTIGIIDQVSNASGVGSITVTMTYDGGEDFTQHTRLFSTIPVGGAGSVGPLTTTQMADLTSTHIASLTPATVHALNDTLIASLTSTQVGKLTSTQLQGLTATQMASLPTTAIAGLTSTQMAAITTTAAAGLQGVTAAPGPLTTTQMAGLNTATIGAVTTTAMAGFTSAQLAAYTTTAVAGLWTALMSNTPSITGGTITGPILDTSDGKYYYYHTFTGPGNFVIPPLMVAPPSSYSAGTLTVDYIMVGGGAGATGSVAGGVVAGGAGAGEVQLGTAVPLAAGSYPVVIGAKGTGNATSTSAGNGSDSRFNGVTAKGGGAGGVGGTSSNNGNSGGSGGGGAYYSGTGGATTKTGTGLGNAGGAASGGNFGGSGGGGAGAAGSVNSGNAGGAGGSGYQWLDGKSYAGGGGGATNAASGNAAGGSSIGGVGGNSTGPSANANAVANTGSGGGGSDKGSGGDGSDGVVVIRYKA